MLKKEMPIRCRNFIVAASKQDYYVCSSRDKLLIIQSKLFVFLLVHINNHVKNLQKKSFPSSHL